MSLPQGLSPGSELSPDTARQLQVASFVLVGTAAVLLWDILDNLTKDYEIFSNNHFQIAAAAYLVSRFASTAFVLGFTIFATHRGIQDCQTFLTVLSSLVPFSSGSASLIFFFRVRAAYDAHRLVTSFFAFLWVCVVGTAILISISSLKADAALVGYSSSSVCIVSKVPWNLAVPVIVLTIHDTSVFVAISCRLLANSYDYDEYTSASVWRRLGPAKHTFSKTLFRDGQNYHVIAILTNLLTIVMIYIGTGPIYQGLFSIPNLALTSIMAGRVYRNARLHRDGVQHTLPQLELGPSPSVHMTHSAEPQEGAAPPTSVRSDAEGEAREEAPDT
ncbi:hypothetical protein K438DRAFT_1618907 [Mycena galopus ATCC 62051]|nr:hypothetical protein K438DRAFT_1618907 [Mycena galopus ATCC 62051]